MNSTLQERVIFRMPSDQLSAFRRRVSVDGLTISFVLRRSIDEYMKTPPRKAATEPVNIPFAGCLKRKGTPTEDYRAQAADYILERCR